MSLETLLIFMFALITITGNIIIIASFILNFLDTITKDQDGKQ